MPWVVFDRVLQRWHGAFYSGTQTFTSNPVRAHRYLIRPELPAARYEISEPAPRTKPKRPYDPAVRRRRYLAQSTQEIS